ncbi:MAG: DegT/DnrJ/EryC1/StrS family aminotransferase [Polyangiaceae bacterium]|nr:DegT/DnrJ/EryC1/StrS family aminotransferase [Polyangiaceae bacterium]
MTHDPPRPIEFYRHSLGEAEAASVRETLASLFLTLGPRVGAFERALAEHLGVPRVVGTSSCTTSLLLALRAMDVGPGDEVITTPMTFVATSNAVLHAGATPVFADVLPRTGLLDPSAVARAITPRTKAIIAVHLYGQLADVRALRELADQHDLWLVEDAAHAVEARDGALRTAALGDATCFSFYATKNLTSGDGGAVAVHDVALAERIARLRNHGVSKDAASRHGGSYQHWDLVELGYKAAMTDVEAALLLPQLPRIEEKRALREALARRYERGLEGQAGIELVPQAGTSGRHLFAVLVPSGTREAVLEGLGRRRIGCAINYRAVHTLAYYRERFGYRREAFPIAADFGERTLSLPLWPGLPEADVDRVVEAVVAEVEAAARG